MAGDWIKLQKDTPDKPEVQAIAARLGIDPDAVVGKLVRVWSWFDTHTSDGYASCVTFSLLDRLTAVTGFAEQMALVGWLSQSGSVLTLPNFGYHAGETAKTRALSKNRNEKLRNNKKRDAPTVTESSPEKRREEYINTNTNSLSKEEVLGFDEFWNTYPRKEAKAAAKKAFSKVKNSLTDILADIELKKGTPGWFGDGGKYIPHAATYLNNRRWEDEAAPASTMPSFI